jgi:hypothetical protein
MKYVKYACMAINLNFQELLFKARRDVKSTSLQIGILLRETAIKLYKNYPRLKKHSGFIIFAWECADTFGFDEEKSGSMSFSGKSNKR